VATPGNDHRLGAHEAPPAIMSIYLGDVLHEVIQQIIEEDPENMSDNSETKNNISISSYLEMGELISPVERDKTDRNRTSPFAFTGNKFEFRAPGSSQALAQTNMILNAIVADAISEMIQKIHEIKEKKMKEKGLSEKDALELSIKIVIRDIFKKHSRIIFEGNGYSPEWIEEAKKRGLPNYKDSVEALSHITDEKNIQLFENLKILKKEELISRVEIFFEHWVNTNLIESKLIVDLTNTHVIPAAIKQQKIFSSSILNVKSVDPHLDIKEQEYQLKRLSTLLNQTILENRNLDEIIQKENTIEFSNGKERAEFIRDQILPLTKSVRKNVDVLEGIIEDSLWTLPKYQEMLFLK
jgi:glutamine synthetase